LTHINGSNNKGVFGESALLQAIVVTVLVDIAAAVLAFLVFGTKTEVAFIAGGAAVGASIYVITIRKKSKPIGVLEYAVFGALLLAIGHFISGG
jgi:hypothetical protein